jgi:plastocyanin
MHESALCLLAAVLLWARAAGAVEVEIEVRDVRGNPVRDAVVTVVPQAGTNVAPLPAPPPRTHTIDQKNETFIPYIEVFRPGDRVVFHNSDHTRHHVYSFAPARQFEFVLAPGDSSAPLQLDKPGFIAVGCNIHDHMITYLYVTDTPVVARSGADGRARIDLPGGRFDVRVWHPQQRPGAADNVQSISAGDVAEPPRLAYTLQLLPDPRVAPDRERASY